MHPPEGTLWKSAPEAIGVEEHDENRNKKSGGDVARRVIILVAKR